MDYFARARNFRALAVCTGLIADRNHRPQESHFFFDLNQGGIYSASQNPEQILQLVYTARMCAPDEGYGEHNALLQLVTRVSELGSHSVYWNRSYHVNADNKTEWVSLAEWLNWCGKPYPPT